MCYLVTIPHGADFTRRHPSQTPSWITHISDLLTGLFFSCRDSIQMTTGKLSVKWEVIVLPVSRDYHSLRDLKPLLSLKIQILWDVTLYLCTQCFRLQGQGVPTVWDSHSGVKRLKIGIYDPENQGATILPDVRSHLIVDKT